MPKRCAPCLGAEIKKAILDKTGDLRVRALLEKITDCPDPQAIELCGKAGRKPSAYQEHIKSCFARHNVHGFSPETMKLCAQEWRERQGHK